MMRSRTLKMQDHYGLDPYEYLLQRFHEANTFKDRDKRAMELLPYVKAKPRSIEIKTSQDIAGAVVRVGGAGLAQFIQQEPQVLDAEVIKELKAEADDE